MDTSTKKIWVLLGNGNCVLLKPIEVDQTQVLKNIIFDFDQYRLEPHSSIELNCLVEFLLQAHLALHIEIEGHTYQIGTSDYNYKLSTKHAQAIYDYLIASGIDAQKLTYQV